MRDFCYQWLSLVTCLSRHCRVTPGTRVVIFLCDDYCTSYLDFPVSGISLENEPRIQIFPFLVFLWKMDHLVLDACSADPQFLQEIEFLNSYYDFEHKKSLYSFNLDSYSLESPYFIFLIIKKLKLWFEDNNDIH